MVRINFGLARNDGHAPNDPADVIDELARMELGPYEIGIVQSNTELTLIVDVRGVPTWAEVETLCRVFAQDCIAAYDFNRQQGYLLGPKSEAWGPFNPAFFIVSQAGDTLAP